MAIHARMEEARSWTYLWSSGDTPYRRA